MPKLNKVLKAIPTDRPRGRWMSSLTDDQYLEIRACEEWLTTQEGGLGAKTAQAYSSRLAAATVKIDGGVAYEDLKDLEKTACEAYARFVRETGR